MNKIQSPSIIFNLKKVTFLLLILISVSGFSQNKPCTIYFKDNTKLVGLGKLKLNGTVKFRLNEDSKSEFYEGPNIDKVEMEQEIYQYKTIQEEMPIWMKLLIKGKVNLYTNDVTGYRYMGGAGMGNGMGGMGMGGMYGGGTVTYYYVNHEGDKNVIKITAMGTFSRNFKNAASDFFKDCPLLVEKIQNKAFKKGDIQEVVNFYNSQCGKTETQPATITN